MKIAILILTHKNMQQLERLINILEYPDIDIFIHLDSKCNEQPGIELTKKKNIYFLEKRHSCYLFHYSLVEATLEIMQKAYRVKPDYKYYILLSGQDYPIKKISSIVNFLKLSYPREFIDLTKVKEGTWCHFWGKKCYNQYLRQKLFDILGSKLYFSIIGSILRAPVKCIVDNVQTLIYGRPIDLLKKQQLKYAAGSAWWMLTDQSVKYILKKTATNKKIAEIFRFTQVPDECFFQTILADTPFENNIKSLEQEIRYPDPLITRMDRKCSLRFIFDYKNGVSTGHPYALTSSEYDMLINSNSLFARKVDLNEDGEIVDMLDKYIK